MIKAGTFNKPFGFSLLPVYLFIAFFSFGTLDEEQKSSEIISPEISQNINLKPSPQNFTTTSLNISKPVYFYFHGTLQKIKNKFLNVISDFYLSKVQPKKQFTSTGALYLFNKVLIH